MSRPLCDCCLNPTITTTATTSTPQRVREKMKRFVFGEWEVRLWIDANVSRDFDALRAAAEGCALGLEETFDEPLSGDGYAQATGRLAAAIADSVQGINAVEVLVDGEGDLVYPSWP